MVLGKDLMFQHDLNSQKDGYFNGYDSDINPSAANSFVSQVFRFGHSLLPSSVERWSKSHRLGYSSHLNEDMAIIQECSSMKYVVRNPG